MNQENNDIQTEGSFYIWILIHGSCAKPTLYM